VLITDVIPDDRVKASMNSINAALCDQEAAKAQGEAKRILLVAQAEAEKQAKILPGEGIAGEREAVAKGLQKSILEIKDAVPDVSEADILAILALTQHYDTLKSIGASDRTNTILVPHTPDAGGALMTQLAEYICHGRGYGWISDTSDEVRGGCQVSGSRRSASTGGVFLRFPYFVLTL